MLSAVAAGVAASGSVQAAQGVISLEEECPGDGVGDGGESPHEFGFLLALLTPILTKGIDLAIKGVGQKLKAAASEQNVDALHAGDFFYTVSEDGASIKLRHRCLIVASKGTYDSKRKLAALGTDYKAFTHTGFTRSLNAAGPAALTKKLNDLGFSDNEKPGVLAIFDVQVSPQAGEFRYVPRYVFLDHSIREKKTDGEKRTFTFEINASAPGSDKPFGAAVVKFDDLRIGQAFTQQEPVAVGDGGKIDFAPAMTSHWMSVPGMDTPTQSRITKLAEAAGKAKAEEITARLAGAAAVKLGNTVIEESLSLPCPDAMDARRLLVEAHARLEVENTKKPKNEARVALHTNEKTYFDSCIKLQGLRSAIDKGKFSVTNNMARSYDIDVIIKEFRKRPAAEFFGDILSDDETRKSLTNTLVGAIDPATRAENTEEEAKKRNDSLQALETAVVAAETAILAYNNATGDNDRASKYIDMESKKRAANRNAADLDLPLPYPASGTWIYTGQ